MTLAIDFDDVLCDSQRVLKGQKMGVPVEGAIQAMTLLNKKHFLIVHTVRAAGPAATQAVEKWLKYFDIPFHIITNIKPNADYYIDNKAIAFTGWGQKELEQLK